jgi:coproporphyrinogen III oxidase
MMRKKFSDLVKNLQDEICNHAEKIDGKEKFLEDKWQRTGGGGGITKVLQNGAVFEKAGVNTSEVFGKITPEIRSQLNVEGENFFATGISLIMHPYNPMVPTTHANFRYFEVTDDNNNVIDMWFGGGADLTPYYLFDEDAIHFHSCLKKACDKFDETFYNKFKSNCDEYFTNHHRNSERRGIGGTFYDRLKPSEKLSAEKLYEFSAENGKAFISAYFPIVEKRKNLPFTQEQQKWQLIRRGRYVEFNLIHDKGTIFGLKSNGRTESILVSLPLNVRFEYDFQPETNSEEERLLRILKNPINWI